MADDTQTTATTTGTPDAAQNTETTPDKTVPYSRFKEVNDKLRELERLAKDQQAASEKAKADALAQQGEYKKLYEDTSAKLPTLEAKAKDAETYAKVFSDILGKRMESVPTHIRSLLEKMPPVEALQWLEDNAEALKPTNPGSLSNRGGTVTTDNNAAEIAALTPLELQIAQMSNMSPAEYVQYRKMGEIQRKQLAEEDIKTK